MGKGELMYNCFIKNSYIFEICFFKIHLQFRNFFTFPKIEKKLTKIKKIKKIKRKNKKKVKPFKIEKIMQQIKKKKILAKQKD